MFEKQLRGHRAIGYAREEQPDETVEYDQDVRAALEDEGAVA